jgi:16S rRNA (guanine966-N2)-methyltransferase
MRITGGVHRSRPLRAPKGVNTRPTSDRVREALFAILQADRVLDGARVVDLYAGTGALGLEALSRGARHATFVECARSALEALRANVAALGLEREARIVPALVERSVEILSREGPFDLVLADPPYALVRTGELADTLGALVGRGFLAEDARVVVEHSRGDRSPSIEGLSVSDARRYGDTVLTLYTAALLAADGSLSTRAAH